MNERDDLLEREIREFAAVSPPPERPGLRADLLAEFDRGARVARVSGRWRRLTAPAAAAVLLFAAVRLILVPAEPPRAGETAAERLAALTAELDEIAAGVARLRLAQARAAAAAPAAAEQPAGEPRETESDPFLRAYAALGSDPALLRLASARAFETVDAAQAARRYHELLDQYGESPAAAVARARLDSLHR